MPVVCLFASSAAAVFLVLHANWAISHSPLNNPGVWLWFARPGNSTSWCSGALCNGSEGYTTLCCLFFSMSYLQLSYTIVRMLHLPPAFLSLVLRCVKCG